MVDPTVERHNRPRPNGWLAGLAIGLFGAVIACIILDRNAGLTSGLGFLSVVAMLFAVLEPRMVGQQDVSPARVIFRLGRDAQQDLNRAALEAEAGSVVAIDAIEGPKARRRETNKRPGKREGRHE